MINNGITAEKIVTTKNNKIITKEEKIYLMELMTILKNYQENISHLKEKNLLFDWRTFLYRNVKMKEEGKIQEWLYSINFDNILALILEEIQWNIDFILEDRIGTFKYIYSDLHIKESRFYKELERIQKLLIESNKVKLCNNGMIIINNI